MSGLDSVALSVFAKRRVTTNSSRAGILVICSRIIFFNLTHDVRCVGQILKAGLFSDTGPSARPSNVSSPYSLGARVAPSSKSASRKWDFIDRFPMRDGVLDTATI